MHTTHMAAGMVVRPADRLGMFAKSPSLIVITLVVLVIVFVGLAIALVQQQEVSSNQALYGRGLIPYQYAHSLDTSRCHEHEVLVGRSLVVEQRCN